MINKIAPTELINRSVMMFFIKNETINTAEAKYPTHSVKEIASIIIFLGCKYRIMIGSCDYLLKQSIYNSICNPDFSVIEIHFLL